MGLSGSLQVGRSGLLASQSALQVTGNNLANITTKGYHRQSVSLSPAGSTRLASDMYLGRGVQISEITRQVDEALEARLRGAIADESSSQVRQELLTQVEAIHNELSDHDLSTKLSSYFNAWSRLANNPQDASLRTLLIEEGATLGTMMQELRNDLTNLRTQIDQQAGDAARNADDLLSRIEGLNRRISIAGGNNSSGAAGLKDERDLLLQELGTYLDISTVTSPNGVTDVFVGSLPLTISGRSRGVELHSETVEGELQIELRLKDDKSPLELASGRLGALVSFRQNDLGEAIDTLDTFAGQLIHQVNRVHTQGQGLKGFTTVTAATRVADATVALNDEESGLAVAPQHGSFQVFVTQKSTGQRTTATINVDLDGIGSDTTLASLTADLNGVTNVTASIGLDGRLNLAAGSSDFEISFGEDTSGALASLGINTFFTGSDASNIGINERLRADPGFVAAAQGHLPGDNRNALAMVTLRDQPVADLGGVSLTDYWGRHVEELAIRTSQARTSYEADAIVRENLEEQQQQVSGVNADEEAINLLQYQRAYQASARFISTVDELMQTLINMV